MRSLHTTTREEPPPGKTREAFSAESFRSCLTLFDPMNHGPPGSSVHGILQARILEWVAIYSAVIKCEVSEVAQSCPTLCDPVHCSLTVSSVHGIFQARVLE